MNLKPPFGWSERLVVLGNVQWRGFGLLISRTVCTGFACFLWYLFLSSSIYIFLRDSSKKTIYTNKIIEGPIAPSVVKIRDIFYREVSQRTFYYIFVILYDRDFTNKTACFN